MALEDFVLQDKGVFFGDPGISQDAEAGIDPVDGGMLVYDIGDVLLAGLYLFPGGRGKDAFSRAFGQGYYRCNVERIYPVLKTTVLHSQK